MSGWQAYSNPPEFVPLGDLRPHFLTKKCYNTKCWCKPTTDADGCIVHHSMDGREDFETGKRRPS